MCSAPALCPHAAGPAGPGFADRLRLPMRRRMVVQYQGEAPQSRELHLYHGDKDICFDDPAMFAFGEALAAQSEFTAGDATRWGTGYPWPQVRDLLGQLLDEGILRRPGDAEADTDQRPDDLDRPSPLPAAPADTPATWADCEALMRRLTGRALPLGWLEVVVPVFRVPHMVLDADGRQVGEANVFPPAMRLDVPTRWRTCIYEGTRHLSERPMNVTALKAMRAHWGTMMGLLAEVRAAYLQRCPEAANGGTIGHVERFATCVLALPAVLLMRQPGGLASGALHPALSSLFRVTDGLRMTMHQMLFVPLGEPTRRPDAPITGAEVYAYAERNHSFHSDHGVCGGPRAMIEEFLAVAVDGRAPRDGQAPADDAGLTEARAAIGQALDYGLHGLRVHGIVFSLWPAMARTYEAMAGLTASARPDDGPAVAALNARLQAHQAHLRQASYLGQEAWRVDREAAYDDMVVQCERALGHDTVPGDLAARLSPVPQPGDAAARRVLAEAIRRTLGPLAAPGLVGGLADTVTEHLQGLRSLLATATAAQHALNRTLGRADADRALTADDLDLHNRLLPPTATRLPFLPDELTTLFGVRVTVTATALHVEPPNEAPAPRQASTECDRHGAGR